MADLAVKQAPGAISAPSKPPDASSLTPNTPVLSQSSLLRRDGFGNQRPSDLWGSGLAHSFLKNWVGLCPGIS